MSQNVLTLMTYVSYEIILKIEEGITSEILVTPYLTT